MWLRGIRLVDLSPQCAGGHREPREVDIRLEAGRIAEVSPASRWNGSWVMPGLWDHHVHMTEWARAAHRLDLSMTTSPAEVLAAVRAAVVAGQPRGAGGNLVGVGLWHSRWARPFGHPEAPRRADLDAVTGALPTILISADLHSAWFNSAAARAYGLPLDGDGLVAEEEWFSRMEEVSGGDDRLDDEWVGQAARAAAARGVVGIVDFEFHDTRAAWRRRVAAGFATLRVRTSVWPEHLEAAIAAGLRTGDRLLGAGLDPLGLVELGSLKVITDGSLNTRTAWCVDPYPDGSVGAPNISPADLEGLMARAHGAGITSAIHAIGDRANEEVLGAFARVGAGGSIEHAQLLSPGSLPQFAALGVAASVQPAHLLDDRDTAEELWAGRTERAYPFGGLAAAGAELRLGSDAPVAPLDPWLAIHAACTRTGDDRGPWHPEHLLDRVSALRAATARPAAPDLLAAGQPADLVVLGADPLTADASELREIPVLRTICAGQVTFEV